MRTNPVRVLKAQPRFFTAALAGALLWLFLPRDWRPSTRLLIAWDCATGLYLMLALVMMARSNIDRIRYRAAFQDEGQLVILGLTSVTALISLAGVVAQMAAAKRSKVRADGIMLRLPASPYCCPGPSRTRCSRYTMPMSIMRDRTTS